MRKMSKWLGTAFVAAWVVAACGGSGSGGVGTGGMAGAGTGASAATGGSGGTATGGSGGAAGSGGGTGGTASGGAAGAGGASGAGGAAGSGGTGGSGNAIPVTCAEAASAKSHFGCEFWPTVTPNLAWSIFDFAVMVVNPGSTGANVTVTRGSNTVTSTTVPAASAQIVYLPWVSELKGVDSDAMGTAPASGGSVVSKAGAYKLVSSVPVAAYQHSPIEYQGAGGPSGKSWASCPGLSSSIGCFSFSSDSSLLLPTSSLGTSYRVMGIPGWTTAKIGSFAVVTATSSSTVVNVQLSLGSAVVAGGGITAHAAGESFQVNLDAGDAVLLQAPDSADLSGTQISAASPIQVVSGISCTQLPDGTQACDHLEEVLPPASALGKHYVVPVPQGPKGDQPGHVVMLYGQSDGTTLSYPSGSPPGAPLTLDAGQSASLGVVSAPFEVIASKGIGVVSYLPGAEILDPGAVAPNQSGDPASRVMASVEQFRSAYTVAAAPAYGTSHIEVVLPTGAKLMLDGSAVTQTPQAIGSGFGVLRFPADSASAVLHRLEADMPFGVSLIGYGSYTSYAHPGGMNVKPLP